MTVRHGFLLAAVALLLGAAAVAVPGVAAAEMCGDADGNGTVTITDGVRALRAAAELEGGCEASVCDVDGSGAVTVTDGVRVLRAAAGLDADLTCRGLAPDPRSGGDTTVFDVSVNAFGQPAANLTSAERPDFFTGNALFNRNWVTAPSSTTGSDGLGPLFNAASCSGCHFKDGRGRPPVDAGEAFESILVRVSVPGDDLVAGAVAEPRYGLQLGDRAILGVVPEARLALDYEERAGAYTDGEPYSLRAPTLTIDQLAYGPLAAEVRTSLRVAPAVFGLGLLAAIDEATVLERADPADADGDGVSGRAESGLGHPARGAGDRPFRLEGQRPDSRAAGGGGVSRRHRHHLAALHGAGLHGGRGRLPRGCRRRRARDRPAEARSRDLLHDVARRAGAARRRRPGGAAGRGPLRRRRLRLVSSADGHDRRAAGVRGGLAPDHPSLHRSAAARHGSRSGGRPRRFPRERQRVADPSTVGPRAPPDRQPTHASCCTTAGLVDSRRRSSGTAARARRRARRFAT